MAWKNQFCQSCGMPMKNDPQGGGTEVDGSITDLYCSYCYENGEFAQPDFSAEDMQKAVMNKMAGMGFPKFLAKFFVRGIPNLQRWK